MDTQTISIVFIIILSLIIIGLIIYSTNKKTSLINPNNCPKVTGTFSVTPQKSGTTVRICGVNKDKECNFTNVNDLNNAIDICNGVPGCNAFVYSSSINVMSIIDENVATYSDPNYDLYSRQIPLIIN